MDTKTCTRCGETKPLETGFRYRANPTHGRPHWRSECRDCDNAAKRVHAQRAKKTEQAKTKLPTQEELAAWYAAGCRIA